MRRGRAQVVSLLIQSVGYKPGSTPGCPGLSFSAAVQLGLYILYINLHLCSLFMAQIALTVLTVSSFLLVSLRVVI